MGTCKPVKWLWHDRRITWYLEEDLGGLNTWYLRDNLAYFCCLCVVKKGGGGAQNIWEGWNFGFKKSKSRTKVLIVKCTRNWLTRRVHGTAFLFQPWRSVRGVTPTSRRKSFTWTDVSFRPALDRPRKRLRMETSKRGCTVWRQSPRTRQSSYRAQELCVSQGGRPGLPSLISLRLLWT